MNKKILIILIVVVIIALTGVGCLILLNRSDANNNTVVPENEVQKEGEGGSGYVPPADDEIQKELFRIFNEKYPDNYDFGITKDTSKKFTLTDLETEGIDVSFFNSENYSCNKDNTYIEVKYLKGEDFIIRQIYLDCTIN